MSRVKPAAPWCTALIAAKPYSQADLDAVAAELNGRPRETLEFMTPSEKFAEAVASTR